MAQPLTVGDQPHGKQGTVDGNAASEPNAGRPRNASPHSTPEPRLLQGEANAGASDPVQHYDIAQRQSWPCRSAGGNAEESGTGISESSGRRSTLGRPESSSTPPRSTAATQRIILMVSGCPIPGKREHLPAHNARAAIERFLAGEEKAGGKPGWPPVRVAMRTRRDRP